jgi:glycine dehydrogenase subunit 1
VIHEYGSVSGHAHAPNAEPQTRSQMLEAIQCRSIDDLYAAIPEHLRVSQLESFPEPVASEAELERLIADLLARNTSCVDALSFLGGGCWQHYVPAVCDEIAQRAEFLSDYYGSVHSDHGRFQAFFEFASAMGELVDRDLVTLSTYDWGNAAASAIGLACRVAGRSVVLVPDRLGPARARIIRLGLRPDYVVRQVRTDRATGQLDLADLERQLDERVAAVYFENPAYLGYFETESELICSTAHACGALAVVGVDPVSLGVAAPPPQYGADIVCGEIQPLGMHMQFGGGLAGFVASPDTEVYVDAQGGFLIGITDTEVPGEYGFGYVRGERMLYTAREHAPEYAGTATGLNAITAAVYLAAMGPAGMRKIGETIMRRAQYAAQRLDAIPGVIAPALRAPSFKEFVVQFDPALPGVPEVNAALRQRGIFGGKDLGTEFPELGAAALYCVTEIHTQADIDRLATTLEESLARA